MYTQNVYAKRILELNTQIDLSTLSVNSFENVINAKQNNYRIKINIKSNKNSKY